MKSRLAQLLTIPKCLLILLNWNSLPKNEPTWSGKRSMAASVRQSVFSLILSLFVMDSLTNAWVTAKAICSRNYLILVSSGIYLLHTLTWRYGQQPPTVIGLTIALNWWISWRTQQKHRLGPRVWGRFMISVNFQRHLCGGSSQESQVARITPVPTGHWPYLAYLWSYDWGYNLRMGWGTKWCHFSEFSGITSRNFSAFTLQSDMTSWKIHHLHLNLPLYRWCPLCLMTSKGFWYFRYIGTRSFHVWITGYLYRNDPLINFIAENQDFEYGFVWK